MQSFTITSTVKEYPKKHPYETMKRKILGARYELSLVFVGKTRAATLNQDYRKKTYSPNVLSFPLTEKNGEIIICPRVAKSEAARFNLSVDGYIAYLFIHGLLHLKGHDHGDTMDKLESRYLKVFNIK
jgi:probable rRNA maturation factor